MDQWYYAKDGQQLGPVGFEVIRDLAQKGEITATSQVWHESMKDWTPAGQVPAIFAPVASAAPAPDPLNPYAAPQSNWVDVTPSAGEPIHEIVPGSDPLDPMACLKRGFDVAVRNVGTVALTVVIYYAINYGLSICVQLIQVAMFGMRDFVAGSTTVEAQSGVAIGVSLGFGVLEQIVTLFLGLGLTRIWLNLVSGKPTTVGMIFGQGDKLLRAIGASILFGVAVGIGLLLLIVPGVYIALRYGQFLTAMVDKDMGIMESFHYSSSITTNNRGQILVLGLLTFLVIIAGLIALCVGVFAAIPIVWLAAAAAYRWMQFGRSAVMDHPGTQVPLLANQ